MKERVGAHLRWEECGLSEGMLPRAHSILQQVARTFLRNDGAGGHSSGLNRVDAKSKSWHPVLRRRSACSTVRRHDAGIASTPL
jgi:hypothetical protein